MITRRFMSAGAAVLAASSILPRLARADAPPFPSAGKRDWSAKIPTLRIGVLGGENDSDRLGRYEGYRKLLETTYGVPARIYQAADYAGAIQAFGAKQIELANMAPSAYAGAWMDTNGGVEPILVTVEADGSVSYISVMVVRTDSGLRTLPDLKGHTLAWADPNSASGYLIPRFEMKQAGIDPESGKYFSRTGFGGGS